MILPLADVVTAPNPILTERLHEYGARHTKVIENHIPGLFLQPRGHVPRTGLTIGWTAGKFHKEDAEQLRIREVLQRLVDERPDVHVVSIGLKLGLQSERYRPIEKVHVLKLADQTAQFDIGIAPLLDNTFNQAKSNIKLKEYAAGDTPWLASPVGPYLGMGKKQGGKLVADDRWYEELSQLLDNPRERRKLARRGRKLVAGETGEKNAYRWEEAFEDAIERAQEAPRRAIGQ